jgi:hypothetical protein
MDYFRSTALLVALVSSSLPILADLPKIIGPSLFPCMTTSVVPIFMMSPFVVLLVDVEFPLYASLSDWLVFTAE